jgi:hypothetical protein
MLSYRILGAASELAIRLGPKDPRAMPFKFTYGTPAKHDPRELFRCELNYAHAEGNVVVQHGWHFQIQGDWALPKDSTAMATLFASMMHDTEQLADRRLRNVGVVGRHGYVGLFSGAFEMLHSGPPWSST